MSQFSIRSGALALPCLLLHVCARGGSIFVAALIVIMLALSASSAHATTYAVNSLGDTIATDGVITLREAILAANSNFAQGDAPAGGASDTINFAITGTIRLTSALPNISTQMTINGPAAPGITISGDANGSGTPNAGDVRIFQIGGGAPVTISNLTVTGAYGDGIGSALTNFGNTTLNNVNFSGNTTLNGSGVVSNGGTVTLTVNNCTFANNTGAISNRAPLIITNSRFTNNTSGGFGGGGAISSSVDSQSAAPFTLRISDSTFTGNKSAGDGGALNVDGPLQIARCSFTGNSATGTDRDDEISFGGAISLNYNNSLQSGTLSISDSTISGNSAPRGGGGGLDVDTNSFGGDAAGTVILTNCTISGNSALVGGGGIANLTGTLRLQNVTVTNNRANDANIGAGIASLNDEGVRTEIGNSIVAGNIGNDVSSDFVEDGTASTLVSLGFNLIGSGTNAGFNQPGDQRNITNPGLGALANNGGPTQTHLPGAGSLAIDRGNTTLTVDQRGVTRPQGAADDIGSVEVGGSVGERGLVVTTLADTVANDGLISLREAVTTANSDGVNSAITFDATVFAAPRKTIVLNGRVLATINNGTLSITAPAAGVEISGNNASGIFDVDFNANVSLFGLTLTGGNTESSGSGGAIISGGTLLVDSCTLSGNRSQLGGAIFSFTNSSINALTVRNSTLTGNTATGTGGALFIGNGTTIIESSTISGNSAQNQGGGVASSGNARGNQVRNSIIAGNTSSDVDFVNTPNGAFQSNGFNLIGTGTATGAFTATGDVRDVANPGLAALAENGGRTPTRLPQTGSLAIDTGDTTLTVDQRGVTRPQGAADDKGAVEVAAAPVVPLNFGVSILPKAPRTNDVLTATPVIANASGVTFSYVWSVNGVVRPGETTNKLDLSKPGNGDKGQRVSVVVTGRRGNVTGTATNFVTVVNSAPTANNATASGAAGALISLPVSGADADGDVLTFKRVGGPENGTGSFTTTGGVTSFNYRSRAFFNGVEEIRFVALDSTGKDSAPATIRITVSAQPRVIGFGVSLIPFGPRSNTVLTAQPLLGDANGVTFTYQWSVNGVVRPGETGQTLDLGKPGNGNRGDTVSVVVTARRGIDSGTATNSALIVSAAPVANDASASGNAGAQIVIPISGSDADGDAFTFKRVGGPRNGTGEFVTAANGSVSFVYRSRARFNGTETIRFVAIQADGRSSVPATITINVTSSVPDIGFGVSLTPQGPTTNQTLTASLVITNASGITFTYAWSVNGVIRPGETTNRLDLSKPGNGDRGDVVTAIVTARRGDSVSTSRNSAAVVNSAPTTRDASASGISGSEIRVPIVGADIDRDALTFKRVGGPRDGTGSFVTNASGAVTFVYRSRAGFVGLEEIRFVAVDPTGRTSVPATMSINVVASGAAISSTSGAATPSGGGS